MSEQSDSMRPSQPVRITNYRMALGRIGLAAVFLPILIGLGVLFLVDEGGSPWIAGPLLLMSLPFLWYSLTVPVSVSVADVLTVRYLLWRREYPKSEVRGIRFGTIGTQFGPGRAVAGMEVGVREYSAATIMTVGNRPIRMLMSAADAQRIKAGTWLPTIQN